MRTAICIALVAIGITMFGCKWFTSNNNASTAFNIEGKWKLDSYKEGSDSSKTIGWASSKIPVSDGSVTANIIYSFYKDSVVAELPPAVLSSAYYTLNRSAKELTLKADSIENRFAFTVINDSSFSLTGADSSVLWLKKQ